MTKKDSAAVPVPKQKALVINEGAASQLPRKEPVKAGSSKGKGKMEAERPMKRLRPLADVEISRAEFDGSEILSLYSGDDLVLPSTDNAVEDIQEEIRNIIPQALKLANVLTVQLNAMAMRIKELEAENTRAKEAERRLTLALQEKASGAQGSTVAEAKEPVEMARQLQEMKENLKGHKALIRSLQSQLALEKTGTHALVEKIAQLEARVSGQPVAEAPPDVRRAHLMRDVEIAKEVFGEGSKEYDTKRVQLDRLLRAKVADAELKAKEDKHAKLRD